MQPLRTVTVTIAINTATSTAFECQKERVVGVLVPSAWTAADITFDASFTDGTFVKVVNRAGAAYKLTGVATAASEFQLVSGDANQADIIISAPRLRLVSTNTGSEADVNQDAARTLTVVLAPL